MNLPNDVKAAILATPIKGCNIEFLDWILSPGHSPTDTYRELTGDEWKAHLLHIPRPNWGTLCLGCKAKLPYGARVLHTCPACYDYEMPRTEYLLDHITLITGYTRYDLDTYILNKEFYDE